MSTHPAGGDLDPPNAAAAWALRIASGDLTPGELQELRTWLAAHPSHAEELRHAQKVWQGIAPLEAVARRTRPVRWRVGLSFATAVAACLALVAFAPSFARHDITSPVGRVTQSTLTDGSVLWLDSGAAIDFDASSTERTLRVARGRIHVSIAHDSQRPFRVLAKDAVIRDVGTAFTVDTEGPLRVAVSEGAVEVERARSKTQLNAGTAAVFVSGQPALPPARYVPQSEAAWRNGRISLNQTPLGEALRAADRYRPGRIVLTKNELRHRKVSGSLSIDQLDDSLEALALNQRLRLIRLPYLLIVTSDDA